jgi:hypothetical protein
MRKYGLKWSDLENPEYALDEEAPPNKQGGLAAWARECRERVNLAIAQWAVEEGNKRRRDDPLRYHFPPTIAQALVAISQGLPPFLKLCGDMGRAGLRLLAPRLGSAVDPEERCPLCQTGAMTVAHLLDCSHLPQGIKELRTWAIAARTKRIREQLGTTPREWRSEGYITRLRIRDELAMQWPGMTPSDLADHLWWASHAIDHACVRWQQRLSEKGQDRARRLPMLRLGGEEYNRYHAGMYSSLATRKEIISADYVPPT